MKKRINKIKYIFYNSEGYLKYLFAEYLDYITYINAFIIGVIVNYFTDNGFPGIKAPYIIPLIVQSVSKSVVKYKNRHLRRLIKLPSEREDPVFIMNENGVIILSTGITNDTFNKYNVKNISDFIGKKNFKNIMQGLSRQSSSIDIIEVYSELNNKWYEIKAKPANPGSKELNKEYLVWFENITEKKHYEKQLSNILKFSNEMQPMIQNSEKKQDIYDLIADLILKNNYMGVFMSIIDNSGNYIGYIYAYKNNNFTRSDLITIHKESSTTLFSFKKKEKLISADINMFKNRKDFENKFPFDKKIKDFLSFPINNFLNYQKNDISVIAFNKEDSITKYDKLLIEVIVYNVRTVIDLLDNLK